MSAATRFEKMFLTGANCIIDGQVLFVGFHWPMVMARIARRLHAPNIVIVYENGIVEDCLTSVLPTSPCDLTAAENAAAGTYRTTVALAPGANLITVTATDARGASTAATQTTQLVAATPPPRIRKSKTGCGTHDERSMSRAAHSGITRATFAAIPPPARRSGH